MIGNDHLDRIVSEAPVNSDSAKVDWAGYRQLLDSLTIPPGNHSGIHRLMVGVA
jgi:hypothetical protein